MMETLLLAREELDLEELYNATEATKYLACESSKLSSPVCFDIAFC